MNFKFNQWYKSSVNHSNDPFSLTPLKAFEHNLIEVNYQRYGVRTFFPQFCSIEEFEKKIDVNRPLTEEQAKEMHDFIYDQVKSNKDKPFYSYMIYNEETHNDQTKSTNRKRDQ